MSRFAPAKVPSGGVVESRVFVHGNCFFRYVVEDVALLTSREEVLFLFRVQGTLDSLVNAFGEATPASRWWMWFVASARESLQTALSSSTVVRARRRIVTITAIAAALTTLDPTHTATVVVEGRDVAEWLSRESDAMSSYSIAIHQWRRSAA